MLDLKAEQPKKIVDFRCKRANTTGFSAEMIRDLNLSFPSAYIDAEVMAQIAVATKEKTGSQVCLLPFCHTVEAEALGASINLSEGQFGPRAAAYVYHTVEELSHLDCFDFARGRLGEVLRACRILKDQEEKVVLEISGFFTILNSLIDITQIFKALRKDAAQVTAIFDLLAANLYRYIEEAKQAGVQIISYADPAGSVAIVGPKYTEMIAKAFTVPFLKKAADCADENCIIHLCPKTSLILLGLGLAERRVLRFDRRMPYYEACLQSMGKEKIIGQACLKDPRTVLKQGNIWALQLI